MPGETVQIKRYPNRRFYARNTSKYVSLKEIEEMICKGLNVEIRDSQTGDDMTRAVLTQIVVDRQPEKMALFPVDMLHSIVRSNDAVMEFLRDYFRHAIGYLNYLQRHGVSARGLANPMHWLKSWLEAVKSAENGSAAPAAEPADRRITRIEDRVSQLETHCSEGAAI